MQAGAADGCRIGTAGWAIPKPFAEAFVGEGSHLERYARLFSAAEINSSFHRPHKPSVYARWAASVPSGFRFSAKLPREITHLRRLVDATEPLERFLSEVIGLGDRLGALLVQLPPSLRFDAPLATAFFDTVRARYEGGLVCEPRHPSWFEHTADALLTGFRVARVAADPAPVPRAAEPGGWPGVVYRRLHGSPKIYYSAYSGDRLDELAAALRRPPASLSQNWCIFDNTASGAAAGDAINLLSRLAIVSKNEFSLPHRNTFVV